MAKKENNLALGVSESEKVDEYMASLNHPLKDCVIYLRQLMLNSSKQVGEGIYWNAPTFYYCGQMEAFDPKTYKRYIVGLNFYKLDTLRLIFLRGADADDPQSLLEGDYKDGRRLLSFKSVEDIKSKEKAFINIVKSLLAQMK